MNEGTNANNVVVEHSANACVVNGNNNILVIAGAMDRASEIIISRLQAENERLRNEVARLQTRVERLTMSKG